MGRFLSLIILYIIKFALSVRYKVEVRGKELLTPQRLNRGGGTLFLPNHPTIFVDPTLVGAELWWKFSIRPIVVEYMYYTPVVHFFMNWMRGLPIPNFTQTSNSFKRMRSEKALDNLVEAVRSGDNFLIYPGGKVKHTAYEALGGASGLHRILKDAPEANVVLVRTMGLWGSSFSRALTGKTPAMFPTIFAGVKTALRNLIFFTPRRKVVIEFVPAPDDFPYGAGRLELNRWLEAWYNRPDDFRHIDREPEEGGESLVLVSRSFWKNDLPKIERRSSMEDIEKELKAIPKHVQDSVREHIAKLTGKPADQITPDLFLASDLGLDSIDAAEVVSFLAERFEVRGVKNEDITTVGKVMVLAGGAIEFERPEEAPVAAPKLGKWASFGKDGIAQPAEGETIIESFLNQADRRGKLPCCADSASGVLTYQDMKLRLVLIAEYIQGLPGERIGILLPASVGANLLIMACQLAGKVPVMVNWTVGPRHLKAVVEASGIQQVLTSWAFLDKVENVDFGVMDKMMLLLEDARREFGLVTKIKAALRSKKKAKEILKMFGADKLTKDDHAVILFTSGTEAMPKGVPLTHENILSDQRNAMKIAELRHSDVVYGFLPSFHSFGFTVTGLMPLVSGIRVAFSPDPMDAERLAAGIGKWSATIIAGAPTFLMGIFKVASDEQMKGVRLVVSGAEAAPKSLFEKVESLPAGGHLLEGYGITECAPVLTMNRPGKPPRGVGEPLPGVELAIVHPDTHEPIPTGESGLILARGPNVFSGYLQQDLESPFMEHDGKQWYNTGDLGYLDADGFLFISGRLKRFVKIGGEMISLGALETALITDASTHGWVLKEEGPSLCVIGFETPGSKAKLILFTTFECSLKQANASLKKAGFGNLVKLTDHIKIEDIPVMGSGKTHFRRLKEIAEEREGSGS